jgi:alanyl-tRNA synthetase
VHQAGSVVEPDRLRFDFTHHGPLTQEQLERVEKWVNEGIWQNTEVRITEKSYADAVQQGAMALFGEKYGDVVRVVDIPLRSTELCGGTHVRNTGHILLFRIISESGVSAGVRRIVGATGPKAFAMLRDRERTLESLSDKLKVNLHAVTADVVEKKLDQLIAEKKHLEKQLAEARKGSGGGNVVQALVGKARDVKSACALVEHVEVDDVKSMQELGDAIREAMPGGAGVIGATVEGKGVLIVVVGDELKAKGVAAGALVKDIAALGGGRGGGKPHLAQAGLADADSLSKALAGAWDVLEKQIP